ncbi:Arylsulfatase precursor [Planctomycetes bacterium CA13]|uniref:Arylsulfatase n=1 Tax=Novipirellula herctigrandis TaxID=2527986 RepID=A0A5C5Z2B2_9BACT|nr:Arylsulfatase precursor [Planctomycetes bacterium CA13]
MKRTLGIFSLFSLILLVSASFADAQEKPNIVFILADDLGYGDLGCYGHPYAKTPNIDGLAKSGTRFSRFYATGVTCQPSRTGFMTSRHPRSFERRIGDFGFADRATITQLLKNNGYATGHFGKWHIGPGAEGKKASEKIPPVPNYGIDEVKIIGSLKDRTKGRDDDTFEATIDFIQRHKDEPFYVNVWAHITHFSIPSDTVFAEKFRDLQVDESLFGPYMKANKFDICRDEWGRSVDDCMKNYLADVWSLDAAIGRLLKKLDQLGLSQNTIVVFASDQGPARNTLNTSKANQVGDTTRANMMGWPKELRGGKHEMYEGGVRIPFIVRWPGKVPVDTVNETSILSGLDFLPTLCHLTDTPYDKDQFEGLNVADVWLGKERNPERYLYWKKQYPTALHGDWKYHVNRRDGDELYDLVNDPNETVNVIAKHPEKASSMLKSITAWDESLPALPRPATPLKPKTKKKTDRPKSQTAPTTKQEKKESKAEPASYPWQNYNGPLQQNWFELHDGLKNSQYIFATTKKGTVAFVGGSITGMPWRKKVMENLKRRFPSTEFKFILAGVGSTGTMYGSFRLDRDVIQKGKVDLLFEEAAVNDVSIGRTADQAVRGMEGIVRRARRANPDMDIVMMHFACPDKLEDYENGKTPEVLQSFDKVAAHYGVPTLDITEEIYERIKRGEFTWKGGIKGVHPSPFGQQLYADSIERLLDEAWSGKPRPVVAHAMPEKLDPSSYDQGKLFPPQTAANLNGFAVQTDYDAAAEGGKVRTGWNERPQLIGHNPGDSFDITFKGSAVAIQIIAGPKAGIIEHSVDGSDWVKQDLFVAKNSFKLHLNRIYILREGLDPEAEHTLTVRISDKRNELSKGNNCRIVYFGLSGDPRSPEGVNVDGIYFDGSDGHGPEK